jgi:hypothetical protein
MPGEVAALDPKGGRIDQPPRVEGPQLTDLATSAIYNAGVEGADLKIE